ncbi:MAG: CDP-glycerol glycerophosphotransferase family protein, partial [Clostridiales bacterium]|nr:CDP-glycerol glycerophosphotransferase family protein [Clostridiales bacterium]
VIQFMSLKHMVYLLAARLLVSSDSKAHAYAWRCKESIIQPYIEKNKKLVFLQHGVIALKKVEFFSSGTNAVSLFVTSNDMEHDIIINELGYQPQEVIITGLARWDVLEDRSAQMDRRTILIMPTWRNWLEEVSDQVFRASDYYQNYMALLNSPRLEEYLQRYDLYLNFYIHPKFREYLGNFSISDERVRLIPFGSEPLNRLMMECSLLITDYSSVCWDVFYQAKPVIFYQFDVDKYNETQGAYIDLEHDLFGDRAVNNDQLFALMEEYAANGFQLKPQYAEMRKSLYKYIDKNNSQRVCDEIQKRNW